RRALRPAYASIIGQRTARRRPMPRRRPGGPMTTNAASIAPENRQALRCNAARLWDSLMQLARIGATPAGGVRRLTLSDLDGEARRHAIDWLRDCGCSIRIDAIGNIHATRPGTEE